MVLGLKFSFLLTHLPNVYLYVKVGPASEPETCVLIGYPRVQNAFSFDSHPDFPQKNKKRNACSLYNFVSKRFFLSHELKLFQQFWLKQRSQIRSKWKQNKAKITTRLTDSFGNSMVRENILLSSNVSFDPLLTKPSFRSLKCSEGNWPMYSILKLTIFY